METRLDSYSITTEQNVQFQAGIYHEKIQLDQIQNGRLAAMILICVITGKTVPDC